MQVTVGSTGPINATIKAPPSKSYTHRALIIAGLSDGISIIREPLDADDIRVTARSLMSLGIKLLFEEGKITVWGTGGKLTLPSEPIDIGDSGTSMRLLTAVSLLANGPVILTGSKRMQKRPIGPLVTALNQIGAEIAFLKNPGCPPIEIKGTLKGGSIIIDGNISSQFISSVLIAAPYAGSDINIQISGTPVSKPYIMITLDMMHRFGVLVNEDHKKYIVKSGTIYKPIEYMVEGDYSSASYWFALAAVTKGKITVTRLNPDSVQGDKQLLNVLEDMGCNIEWDADSVTVSSTKPISGVEVDMTNAPDVVQTLCMVAACANSPSNITGIHHLRTKESDRVAAIADGLKILGGDVIVKEDSITIIPAPLHGGVIDAGNDHRTAMSFAILGCSIGDVTIIDAECVTKSYPKFWEELRSIWKNSGSCL